LIQADFTALYLDIFCRDTNNAALGFCDEISIYTPGSCPSVQEKVTFESSAGEAGSMIHVVKQYDIFGQSKWVIVLSTDWQTE
jgi:hypothetical protein